MHNVNTFADNVFRDVTSRSLDVALNYIDRQPETSVLRVLRLLERLAPMPWDKKLIQDIRHSWVAENGFGQLMRRLVYDVNPKVRKNLINNILVNNAWGTTRARRQTFEAAAGFEPPFTYLISPSMRCNLDCTGCYANEYTIEDDLPIEVVDRVIAEGKKIGIHFVVVLGGEPFIRKDMWDIYAKHQDVEFMVFTNGTPLTQSNVDRIARLGNILPVVSVEGWTEETDARRGEGMFSHIIDAFGRMRRARVLFGFSSMVTRYNVETICSDAFNDEMVRQGCMFGWHFLYMPVGRDPDLSLMPTPAQRDYMRTHGARRIREEMPLLVMDFWNDAPFVGGCIAGGRKYFHVNNRGDVEPCIFVHFATDNVRDKPLSECLQSEFFQAIRAGQPYNDNLLLPCMLIDNPQVFREVCAQCRPRATHVGADALVTMLVPGIDAYAAEVQTIMDDAWQQERGEKADDVACIV